jgi:hypothetical protein
MRSSAQRHAPAPGRPFSFAAFVGFCGARVRPWFTGSVLCGSLPRWFATHLSLASQPNRKSAATIRAWLRLVAPSCTWLRQKNISGQPQQTANGTFITKQPPGRESRGCPSTTYSGKETVLRTTSSRASLLRLCASASLRYLPGLPKSPEIEVESNPIEPNRTQYDHFFFPRVFTDGPRSPLCSLLFIFGLVTRHPSLVTRCVCALLSGVPL